MEFWAQYSQKRIIPLYGSDDDIIQELKPNILYKWKVWQSRGLKFHKKFFALLNLGYQNQNEFNNFDEFREWQIIRAGFYKTKYRPDGIIKEAKSVGIESMDELEFSRLYDAVLVNFCKDLDTDQTIINNELKHFM